MLVYIVSQSYFMYVNLAMLLTSVALVTLHALLFTPSILVVQSPESINKPAWNQYLQTEEPEPIVSLDEDKSEGDGEIVEGDLKEIE